VGESRGATAERGKAAADEDDETGSDAETGGNADHAPEEPVLDEESETSAEPEHQKGVRRTNKGRKLTRNPSGNYWDTQWLNKTFPKKDGCGEQAPPPNWRHTAQRVRFWREQSRDSQKREWVKFRALSDEEKKEHAVKVPGVKKKYPKKKKQKNKAKRSSSSGSSRRPALRSDKEVEHTSLSDDAEKRKRKVTADRAETSKKPKRKALQRPVEPREVHDARVIELENRVLKHASHLIYNVSAETALSEDVDYSVAVTISTNAKAAPKRGGAEKVQSPKVKLDGGWRKTIVVSASLTSARTALKEGSQVLKENLPPNREFHVMLDSDEEGREALEQKGIESLHVYGGDILSSVAEYSEVRANARAEPRGRGGFLDQETSNEVDPSTAVAVPAQMGVASNNA